MNTPPSLPKIRASHRRWVVAIVTVLFLPPIALVIWYLVVRSSNASAIRKLEDEARQHGEPLTLAELKAKYPPIPDEENAAAAFLELWQGEDPVYWLAFENGERPLPERETETYDPALPYLGSEAHRMPRVSPLNTNSLAAAESYLNAKSAYLDQVRTALRRPRFRFPINFEPGSETLLPHLPMLRAEAQNFHIAALMAAERGNKGDAIANMGDAAHIGQLLTDEPILISQLVRVACLSLVLEGAEQLLSRQILAAEELEKLRLLIEQLSLPGAARMALVSERPFSLCAFDPEIAARVATNGSFGSESENSEQTARSVRAGFRFLHSIGYLERDRYLMLETFSQAIPLAEKETPESLQKLETLFDEAESKARKFPPKLFSAMMLPLLKKVPAKFASFEARRRSALVALAVERFRLEHEGRTPEQPGDLVPAYLPAEPMDPFDGRALRFRRLERGYVVYSIGGDGEDNGGKEQTGGGAKQTDVTFTVER